MLFQFIGKLETYHFLLSVLFLYDSQDVQLLKDIVDKWWYNL